MDEDCAARDAVAQDAADGLVRLRLDFAYDGGAFSGWAAQPGRRTVQEELTAALARILRIPPPTMTTA